MNQCIILYIAFNPYSTSYTRHNSLNSYTWWCTYGSKWNVKLTKQENNKLCGFRILSKDSSGTWSRGIRQIAHFLTNRPDTNNKKRKREIDGDLEGNLNEFNQNVYQHDTNYNKKPKL